MSAHKMTNVTISQEEYRRLYEAEQRFSRDLAEYSMKDHPITFDEHVTIFEKILGSNNLSITDRPQKVVQNNHLQQYEMDQLRQLIKIQQQSIQDRFAEQVIHHEEIESKQAKFHAAIRLDLDAINQTIFTVRENLAHMDFAEDQRNQNVSTAIHTSQRQFNNLMDLVVRYCEFPDFPTEKLQAIYDIERTINSNFESGFYEVVIGQYQWANQSLINLILEFEAYIDEIRYTRMIRETEFHHIETFIKENKLSEALTKDGIRTGIFLDLNDWSDGLYPALIEQVDQIFDEYFSGPELRNLSTYQSLDRVFDGLMDQYQSSIICAHTNAINSQMKYELANNILVALVAQGYIPQEGIYEVHDGKERYAASAINPDGSDITIYIDTDDPMSIGNKLSIFSSDYRQRTPYELSKRVNEIKESIESYGFDVGDFKEVPTRNDRPYRKNNHTQHRVKKDFH